MRVVAAESGEKETELWSRYVQFDGVRPDHLAESGGAPDHTYRLRSLAAQALGHGHLVTAIDAEHTGHFDVFSGRDGVLRVESQPAAAMDLLDWVCAESTRRAERRFALMIAGGHIDVDQDTRPSYATRRRS